MEKDLEAQRLAAERIMQTTFRDTAKVDLIKPQTIPLGSNNQVMKNLKFKFEQVDYTVAHMILADNDSDRYEVPEDLVNAKELDVTMKLDMCGFEMKNEPFSFSFNDDRTSDKETLITTENQSLLLMDKYMQMDFLLPSKKIYGLGERNREFDLGEGTWTMWAHGRETPYDDGTGGKQTYGVHPFALIQSKTPGLFMGMYFRNSNAQSPIIKHNEDGTSVLSYITTGGVIDVYFMMKGSAKEVIRMYQNIIGKPSLPPFWALGWHSASYGYFTLDQVKENYDNYNKDNLPIEGVWLDIKYMDDYKDFSVDGTNFKDLKTFTTDIQKAGSKMIVIVDAGISADDENDKYWKLAQEGDYLVKTSLDENKDKFNGALSTTVWPKHTVFLDFFNDEGVKKIWNQGLKDLHDLVPFNALWLDMNEITGFCDGECPEGTDVPHYEPNTTRVIRPKMQEKRQLKEDKSDFLAETVGDD